jgi:hypothetical protein
LGYILMLSKLKWFILRPDSHLLDVRGGVDDVVVVGEDHEVGEALRRQEVVAPLLCRRLKVPDDGAAFILGPMF